MNTRIEVPINRYNLFNSLSDSDDNNDDNEDIKVNNKKSDDSNLNNNDIKSSLNEQSELNKKKKIIYSEKTKIKNCESVLLDNDKNKNCESVLLDNDKTKIKNCDSVLLDNDKTSIYVPPNLISFDRYKKKNIENTESNENKLTYYNPEIKLKGDDMKLNTSWTVWIHENENTDWTLSSYKPVYEINSIGSMWRFLWILDNLNKNVIQYYIMRNGITPIWEDNNNKNGAICSIMIDNLNRNSKHMRGDLGVDAFSAICILVMNESFVKNNHDINGLCYSIKSRSVLIKLWVKDYTSNMYFIDKLPITILKCLDTLISNMDTRSHVLKSNGKSKVSVQLKQIKPEN